MVKKTPKEIRDTLREFHKKKNGCDGKIKYLDEASARSRADRDKKELRDKRRKKDGAHRPYRCQFCGYWHIGTIKNPAFRMDFVEMIKKGEQLLKEIPSKDTRLVGSRTDLRPAYERGMLGLEDLIHGDYYLGYSKHAVVARWHEEKRRFFYQRWSNRDAHEKFEASAPHPEHDEGGIVFLPLDRTEPTFNQMVSKNFEEALQGK